MKSPTVIFFKRRGVAYKVQFVEPRAVDYWARMYCRLFAILASAVELPAGT